MVVSAQAARLDGILATAREHGAALTLIDSAPHAESGTLAAARAADLVLVPCRPSILDLRTVTASRDIATLTDITLAAYLATFHDVICICICLLAYPAGCMYSDPGPERVGIGCRTQRRHVRSPNAAPAAIQRAGDEMQQQQSNKPIVVHLERELVEQLQRQYQSEVDVKLNARQAVERAIKAALIGTNNSQ